jgi:hypothetical protein
MIYFPFTFSHTSSYDEEGDLKILTHLHFVSPHEFEKKKKGGKVFAISFHRLSDVTETFMQLIGVSQ